MSLWSQKSKANLNFVQIKGCSKPQNDGSFSFFFHPPFPLQLLSRLRGESLHFKSTGPRCKSQSLNKKLREEIHLITGRQMHIILLVFSPLPPVELRKFTSSTVWRIKNVQRLKHFSLYVEVSPAWRGERGKKWGKVIPQRDRSCSGAGGGVRKSATTRVVATQTVVRSTHRLMHLFIYYWCVIMGTCCHRKLQQGPQASR